MSRTKKTIKNVFYGVAVEAVKLACGLILPRLILTNYGSAYNGIVQSISNFLSCIALMKMGIGDATRVALFKPLANKDDQEVSEVLASTESFMRRIAAIFAIFVIVFACVYPLFIADEFDWLFSATLVLIISIVTFAEYYFGFTYQMLLSADQKGYIYSSLSIVTTVLNAIISVILINNNLSIHVVKLGTSLVYLITPVFLYIYCHRKYNIIKIKKTKIRKIPQRWDAFTHEVASFVNDNTDTLILTVFSTLLEVSVYTVYHYVIVNLKKIMSSFVASFGSAFGDMYAKEEKELMLENLRIYELITYSFVSTIYSTSLVLIVPFALLYTKGVTDVNYSRPLFGIIITLGGAFNCYRYPYKSIINCTGHFKQTKKIAIAEAVMNIVISIFVVAKFGLIGVVVGTLCTMIFGTIMYSNYVSDNIVYRNKKETYFHLMISLTTMLLVYVVSRLYMNNISSYFWWIIYAIITVIVAATFTMITNYIFYKKEFKKMIDKVFEVFRKKYARKK